MDHWAQLKIRGVSKQFDRGPMILSGIELDVKRGSFLCILGPSGSGKTTFIDLIAGFEAPTEGTIRFDEQEVKGPGPDRVVIFQDISNALFPWLTVLENVTFGLQNKALSKDERLKMGREALELVGLHGDLDKYPSELSGGMKQRAQIARGLVMDPHVLIMDEPFAALDAITRGRLQLELKEIWRRTHKTIIFITHDIDEALILATDVAVLSKGPGAHILETFEPGLEDSSDTSNPEYIAAHQRIEQLIGHAREEQREE